MADRTFVGRAPEAASAWAAIRAPVRPRAAQNWRISVQLPSCGNPSNIREYSAGARAPLTGHALYCFSMWCSRTAIAHTGQVRARAWALSMHVRTCPRGVCTKKPMAADSATISGDLAIAHVPVLREQLLGVLRPHASRIVIDLSGVTFCDASGLAVLVGVERRARLLGGVLRLAAPARPVAAVLRLTGLDLHFQIFATVLAAIRASAHPGVRGTGSPTRVPAGHLGVPEVSDTESLGQAAIGDDDDVREAIAAVLAQADA
jgi:anti-anti-sigma factor